MEPTGPSTRVTPAWLPWALLGLLVLLSAAFVLWAGRDTVFRGDDWDLLLYRGGTGWDVFLTPHNEHLSALLVAAYKAIPLFAGPHYGIFRALLFALLAAVAIAYFAFARERVGSSLALLTTAPLLFMGAGSDNLLWPTQIGVVGSLASGIAVLILLDRQGTAAKLLACLLLVVSIAFSSDGLFFLVCAAIWLALSPGRRRDLWIVAVAGLAYLTWYVHYGSSTFSGGNLEAAPRFIAESAAAGVGALTGLRALDEIPLLFEYRAAIGLIGAVVLVAAFGTYLYKARPLSGRSIAILALPVISWTMIALGRAEGGDAFASRYAYASALFVLMAVVELVRGDAIRQRAHGWLLVVVGAGAALSVSLNAKLLIDAGDYWRGVSQAVRGRTAAIQMARPTVDPNLQLEPLQDMAHMTAGWYLDAVERFGSSPTGEPDPAELDAAGKTAADQVLVAAEVRFARPAAGQHPEGPPPGLEPPVTRRTASSCLKLPADDRGADVLVPRRGMLIVPGGEGSFGVSLRRFSPTYEGQAKRVLSGRTLLVPALDSSPTRWHARITSRVPISLCGTVAPQDLLRPPRPAGGNQHCVAMSVAESECRFNRY